MRRLLSIFLIIILLLLVSCKAKSTDSGAKVPLGTSPAGTQATKAVRGDGQFSLYFSSSDSLNPYKAVSAGNLEIMPLLFDSLVKLDEHLNPVGSLAESVKVDGKDCVIKLKSVTFSDGSKLTAEDVTYSIKQLRKSETSPFTEQLDNVYSYNAASGDTVSIRLKEYDPYFESLLDFPIIKMNSEDRENEDKKELPPIGSGRYVYEESQGEHKLVPNKNYWNGAPENSVVLTHVPDSEALQHSIKIGDIDFYYSDMRKPDLPTMNGKLFQVSKTNLVYLGANGNRSASANPDVRLAMSAALSRDKICEDSYFTYAKPANSPYPAGWKAADGHQSGISSSADAKKMVEHLREAGYNKQDKDGFYVDAKNERLNISLLYNEENVYQTQAAKQIGEQLKKAGIAVLIVPSKQQAYSAAVAAGNYDFYLGEVKLSKSMNLSPFFKQELIAHLTTAKTTEEHTTEEIENSTQTTTQTTEAAKTFEAKSPALYADYLKGDAEFSAFYQAFSSEIPFIPVCHRLAVLSYSAKVTGNLKSSVSDAYYNLEELGRSK